MMTRTMILALSLTIGSAPALAAPAADHATATIRIDDLRLTSAADQQRLDTRIKSAARSLCGTDRRGTTEMARKSQCIADALASAKPQAERLVAQAQSGTQLALLMVTAAR